VGPGGVCSCTVGPAGQLLEDSLILNTRVAPFNDRRVRRALNYAVDRAEVARLVGAGAQPTCQTLTPWFTGYQRYCPYTRDPSPKGVWHAPNPTTAQRLINASHTRGTTVTIWLAYGAPATAGRYLVTLLDRLGYPARLRDVSSDPTAYAQFADSRTKAQAFVFRNYAPYPSASQLIGIYFGCQYFIPNSPLNGNIAEFCDRHLDALRSPSRRGQSPTCSPLHGE
jgi:peptide/nickel transport system substrate-binding protein